MLATSVLPLGGFPGFGGFGLFSLFPLFPSLASAAPSMYPTAMLALLIREIAKHARAALFSARVKNSLLIAGTSPRYSALVENIDVVLMPYELEQA